MDKQQHWETVYQTKDTKTVSWYQPTPETSLSLIEPLGMAPDAALIDVGGGDSRLVDQLLARGFRDLTVLDVSQTALSKAASRLGEAASEVDWICADAAHWQPVRMYDLWHDRAAFHFLTDLQEARSYVAIAAAHIRPGGYLVLGTFSHEGPQKCSGLPVQRYSAETLQEIWADAFETVRCLYPEHLTPSGTVQEFLFCTFRRKAWPQ